MYIQYIYVHYIYILCTLYIYTIYIHDSNYITYYNANMSTFTTTVIAGSAARWCAVCAHLPEIRCLEMVSYYCYYL